MTSIDTSIYVKPSNNISAYSDWLQMITGASLIIFMWSHMILVASVNFGVKTMNSIAWFFESTYMVHIGGPLISIIIFTHFILASRKIPFSYNEQKIIWKHTKILHHFDTWLWIIQISTAIVILFLGSIHVWTVLTDLPITAQKSAARIQNNHWLIFYLFLLPMVEIHVGIGFYRILIKWGIIKKNKRKKIKRLENILTTLMIIIGIITIIRFSFIII